MIPVVLPKSDYRTRRSLVSGCLTLELSMFGSSNHSHAQESHIAEPLPVMSDLSRDSRLAVIYLGGFLR